MGMSTTLKALTPQKTGDPQELRPLLLRLWRHQHPRGGHCCREASGNDGGRGGCGEVYRPRKIKRHSGEWDLICKTMDRCWTVGDISLRS